MLLDVLNQISLREKIVIKPILKLLKSSFLTHFFILIRTLVIENSFIHTFVEYSVIPAPSSLKLSIFQLLIFLVHSLEPLLLSYQILVHVFIWFFFFVICELI